MPSPDDLAWPGFHPDWCVLGHVDDGIHGSVQKADRPRASAIRFFASELGCDFADVRCTTRYIRARTRQEVWDEQGRDRWDDDYLDEHHIEIKWQPEKKDTDEEWIHVDADSGERVELPDSPTHPPEDWEPNEDDGVWEFCKKDSPGAIKVYICEEWEREYFCSCEYSKPTRDMWEVQRHIMAIPPAERHRHERKWRKVAP